jgi:ubiquinone/menaquinone biosynthesis C-methylase UbiE
VPVEPADRATACFARCPVGSATVGVAYLRQRSPLATGVASRGCERLDARWRFGLRRLGGLRALPPSLALAPAARDLRGWARMSKVDQLSLLANAVQADRWNGETGRYWVEHRERHVVEQRNLTPHLFRAAEISQGERVLDVGCGCGETTIRAAQIATSGTAKRVATWKRVASWSPRRDEPGLTAGAVGVDLSRPMLDAARKLVTPFRTKNVRFVLGDAQVYPFPPNSFDVVISSFGVMFFNDPNVAFEHLATAIRPDGRLVFLCWQDGTRNEVFELPLRVFSDYMPLPGPGVNGLFVNPPEIRDLLISSGWKDIDITPVNEKARVGSDIYDVMSYVRGMPSIRRLTANFKDQAIRDKILDAVKEEYAKREDSDGVVWVNASAWLVSARRA